MSLFLHNYTVAKEILKANESILTCYERVTALEKILQTDSLSEEDEETIGKELVELRKLLATNKQQLAKLHGQNKAPIINVTVATVLICFTLLVFYILVVGLEY